VSTPAFGGLEERISIEIARLQAEQRDGFDPIALQWLALAPEWTDTLARAAGFPAEPDDIDVFVKRAANAQLCYVSRNLSAAHSAKIRFRMRDPTRRELIAQWIEQGIDMRDATAKVANAIVDACRQGTDVALGVMRWAELALAELEGSQPTGSVLTDRITMLVENGELAETPTWLYAGEALEAPLGAEMTSAVRRSKAQLNLHYRAEHDLRQLRYFLEREEQREALDLLLDEPHEDLGRWALHFIGMGGVGKTMILRYLTGPYARGRKGLCTARVDFDHVDPRYPTERPGQLLEELANGLSIYIEDRTHEHFFIGMRTAIERANTVAKSTPLAGDALLPLHTREFAEAIAAFASFAASLTPPVLLILDTCEELAKLHPAGENVPSIDATFEILERIHELTPSLRVVFAGRRPLTPSAANWRVEGDASLPPSVMSLRPRPYLVVKEVRGFKREEVRRYLFDVRQLEPGGDLLDAVLHASRETGRAQLMGTAEGEPRFNPFDISRYGDWIAADPGVQANQLATNDTDPIDPYVRVRIIGRIGEDSDMCTALPFAAVLGRFDAALLHAALPGDEERRRRAVLTLAEQEWINLDGGPEVSNTVLAVEPGLLPRLRRYFDHADRSRALTAARERLRPFLQDALLQDHPTELSAEQVDAALRVLPPSEAATVCDALAERVAEMQAWPWAENLGGRLLAVDREDQLPNCVQASVRALYASALQHRGAPFDSASLWRAVQDHASAHPDVQSGAVLEARAKLGQAAALLRPGESIERHETDVATILGEALRHPKTSDAALTPALLCLAETVLEAAEARGDGLMSKHVGLIVEHLDREDSGDRLLDTFVCAYKGRGYALAGRVKDARRLLSSAVQMLPENLAANRQCYADWVVPASPRHRLMLEQLRHEMAATQTSTKLIERCEHTALVRLHTIDQERLLSLVLRARLAQRPLSDSLLARARELEAKFTPPHMTAYAHRAVPPLFVSLADALLVSGRAGEALQLLAEREADAVAARDEETVQASALATMRLLRKLRLDERLGQARELAVADRLDIRTEALAATALIAGDKPRSTWNSGPAHAEWRVWTPHNLVHVDSWRGRMEEDAEPQTLELRVADALDRLELALVLERWGQGKPLDSPRRNAEQVINDLLGLRRGRPDPRDPLRMGISRLALRAQSLELESGLKVDERRYARASGELALEEGELLALRLPEHAAPLLERAEHLLAQSGDVAGAFVAALRRAIAHIHAGDIASARAAHADVERRYQAAQHLLLHQTRTTEKPTFDPWRGWLLRLGAYREWLDGHTDDQWRPDATELRMAPLPGAWEWRRTMPQRLRDFVRKLIRGRRTVSFRLGALLFGVCLAYVMTRLGVPIGISLAAGSVSVSFLVLVTIRPEVALLTLLRRLIVLNVDIAPAPEHGSEKALITVSLSTPSWLAKSAGRVWHGTKRYLPTPVGLEDEPFEKLPRQLVSVLGVHTSRSRRNVCLSVTPDVAVQPWEARLVGIRPLRSKRWTPARAPVVWRRAQALPKRRGQDMRWRDAEGIAAIASHEMQPFVRSALGDSGVEARLIGDGRPDIMMRRRAVLMVGTPVATGSGWRLRLDGESIGMGSDAVVQEPGEETFISPELGSIAPFVIVQAPPGGETPVLDRRSADGLRGFANEAAAYASLAVLAIPSLPSFLAYLMLGHVARELDGRRSSPPTTHRMTKLVTELRTIVFTYEGQPSRRDDTARRVRAQVAYDICLYLPGREV
jgi:AAA ATPase domain